MPNLGIIGCGWLGLHIAKHLSSTHKIYTTTTSEEKNNELIAMDFESIPIQFSDNLIAQDKWGILEELDVIIITVPFSKRSAIKELQNRFENISLFLTNFKKQIFLMSSIGIYPQIEGRINETTFLKEELNSNIHFVEELMQQNFPKINILRLAGLMGGSRVFSNYNISSGLDDRVNHIHYKDICLIIEKMIHQNSQSKIYNVVAPLHPTKKEIIDYQKKNLSASYKIGKERIIESELLEKDLNYKYKHKDPKVFDKL